MEKLNFVKNGVSRLPPGFRFQPTDEELVFEYLKCKIFSSPLPASIIPHANVCNYDPWDLPGNSEEEERYFFSNKEAKYRNGNRMNRTTKSGYWKATGSDKKISCLNTHYGNSGFGGLRKTLVFYKGKAPNGSRTNWIMHEYRLLTTHNSSTHQNYGNEVGDWVVCRISMKARTENNGGDVRKRITNDDVAEPRFFDFMRVHNRVIHGAPPHHFSCTTSSCSSSSAITFTEECCSSSVADHEEETSAYTSHF
ncbi:NAC domain-containing protein 83-like [Senna tora]|uniref:NAC domain-containing protein 83-like n=1 Tax=Senna tora TaxID=362788 RepID=A0A835CBN6_9FABA|nr:NAC domain-containing protein 83-like [Senna tora]